MLRIKKHIVSNELFKLTQRASVTDNNTGETFMEYVNKIITVDADKSIKIYDMHGNKSVIKKKSCQRTLFNIQITDETVELLNYIPWLQSEYIDIYSDDNKICFVGLMYHHGTYYDSDNKLQEYNATSERTIRIPIQIWNCTK